MADRMIMCLSMDAQLLPKSMIWIIRKVLNSMCEILSNLQFKKKILWRLDYRVCPAIGAIDVQIPAV